MSELVKLSKARHAGRQAGKARHHQRQRVEVVKISILMNSHIQRESSLKLLLCAQNVWKKKDESVDVCLGLVSYYLYFFISFYDVPNDGFM